MAQHNCEDLKPTETPIKVPTTFQASSDHTFNPKCAHNPMANQCNQSQYPNPSHNFAVPQFMAPHNCEDLEPTDVSSAVPTTLLAPSDHTFNPLCAHNLMATQCNQTQSPNLDHYFAVPQFIAQHNCQDLDPTDDPITVPTTFQASSHHTFNPKCAHDPMATQCNQSQYLTLMKQNCAHNPSASQVSQTTLSNSLASPYPPDPGQQVLKRSATVPGEENFPVQWFKFIHPSPKPRMTETPVQKPVHVAYSPIASMNYHWTINIHDGYPILQVVKPDENIPPYLHTLCNHKTTMFHLGDDCFCPSKILLPPGDNGENLEAAANEENKINDDLYKFRALNGHQGPPKAPDLDLKKYKYNVLVEWETAEKTYNPLSVPAADDPVTCAFYAKGNELLPIEGCQRFRNLVKREKHDLSSLASPKAEIKRSFSWTSLFKSPTSITLCFGEPTLESSIKSSCFVALHQVLHVTLHLQSSIKKLSFVSPSTFLFLTLLFVLELHSLCQDLLLKQTEFPTDTPA